MRPRFTLIAALILLLATCGWAQITPDDTAQLGGFGRFTGFPSSPTNAQTVTLTSVISVRQGKLLAVSPLMAATNATTANVVFSFVPSLDGTNWCTAGGFTLTNALNGATAVRGYHVVPAATIGPARYLKLTSAANAHTNTITITNVLYAWQD